MRRLVVELLVGLGLSTLVAATMMVAGRTAQTSPTPLPKLVTERPGCLETRLFGLDGSGITGRARLCIVDEGVRPLVDAEGLVPGTAYAMWLAYFDRPRECRKARCTVDDLTGEAAVGVVGRMDGVVADGLQKAEFRGDGRDLRLASGSEVSLLVFERGHVQAGDTRGRARQLLALHLAGLDGSAVRPGAVGTRLVAQAIFDVPTDAPYARP
jgi:hypothetical protein